MNRLAGAATVVNEVHGFRFFLVRDLLGFVDGTENPTGPAAADAVLITDQDAHFAGGSYVIVQKYVDDLRFVDGEIIWAPAIDGAFVMSTRSGDLECTWARTSRSDI